MTPNDCPLAGRAASASVTLDYAAALVRPKDDEVVLRVEAEEICQENSGHPPPELTTTITRSTPLSPSSAIFAN